MARREALILPAQFDGTNTGGGSISSSSSEKVESKMERSNLTERELKALRKVLLLLRVSFLNSILALER